MTYNGEFKQMNPDAVWFARKENKTVSTVQNECMDNYKAFNLLLDGYNYTEKRCFAKHRCERDLYEW